MITRPTRVAPGVKDRQIAFQILFEPMGTTRDYGGENLSIGKLGLGLGVFQERHPCPPTNWPSQIGHLEGMIPNLKKGFIPLAVVGE